MDTSKSSSTTQNGKTASSVTGAVTTDDETMAEAWVLVDSIMLPMTLQAAVELGVLDILAGAGQLTAEEVTGKLPAKENPQAAEMVERILRFLAAFSVVSCSVETPARRVYGLTALGNYFVKNEDGVSMAPMLKLITDDVFVQTWLETCVIYPNTDADICR